MRGWGGERREGGMRREKGTRETSQREREGWRKGVLTCTDEM